MNEYVVNNKKNHKTRALVASVFNDGSFYLNSKLFTLFPSGEIHAKLKPDGTQLVIFKDCDSENEKLHFRKNRKIKNYHLLNLLTQLNISFPVYYVGEWDDEEKLWIGNLSKENPNYRYKNRKK